LAPQILKCAGAEVLGAYAALSQVLGYISLVDFGFSVTLTRFLSQSHGAEDEGRRFRRVLATGRLFLLCSNIVFAALVLVFSAYVGRLFELTPQTAQQARNGLIVLACWAVLRTPLAAYNSALIASQDLAAANLISTVQSVGRLLGALVAVRLGLGLFGIMLASIAVEALASVLSAVRFHMLLPQRWPSWKHADRALYLEMLRFSAGVFVVNIAGQLTFNTGNVVVGSILGAVAVSTFYITQMPTVLIYQLVLRLSDNAMPAVNELWAKGDLPRLRHSYEKVFRLTLMLACPLSLGILLFNRVLIVLWVGPARYGGRLMTAGLALFALIIAVEHINVIYTVAFGHISLLSRLAILEGVATVILSVCLCQHFGVAGATLGLTIAIIPKTLYLFHTALRKLGLSTVRMLREAVMPVAGIGLAAALISFLTQTLFGPAAGWLSFFLNIGLFVGIYSALAYASLLGDDDKSQIRAMFFARSTARLSHSLN